MKTTFSISLRLLSTFCVALWVCAAAQAQAPVTTSFSANGVLVCSNLAPGSLATVEWASSLSGPWTNNWAGLDAVAVGASGMIQVSVPMFYRVLGVAYTINTTTSDGMVLVPAGSFTMGDANDGNASYDAPTHTVNVSAFYMDTNLVSYTFWQQVYQWAETNGYSFDNAGAGKAASHPVQTVNWYDVVKWCNARSEMAGSTPCYYTNSSLSQVAIYRSGTFDLATNWVNWVANGYRLPTEAEWEKAARGKLSGQRFPWGDTISESQANYYGDTTDYNYDLGPAGFNAAFATGGYPYTGPVGCFAPNGYWLYGMAGNVSQWCWDWYSGAYYSSSPGTDPRGAASGAHRVVRGGSWLFDASHTRCANRDSNLPTYADYYFGFRCVRGS
jgi:formylglycine-generating enzyme required for sulfatase activity